MNDRIRKTLVTLLCFSITSPLLGRFAGFNALCAYPSAGSDYLDPTTATIELELFLGGNITISENITVQGAINVSRGTPYDPGDGRIMIDTEIISMNLAGNSDYIGPITIVGNSSKVSNGAIQQRYYGVDFPASSFFDVFVEIQTIFSFPVDILHNDAPMFMNSTIFSIPPLSTTYLGDPTPVPLKDQQNNIVGSLGIGQFLTPLAPAGVTEWTGKWCCGGHWLLGRGNLTFKFVDPGTAGTTLGHPVRAWTEAEKNAARSAIKEWNDTDACVHGKIIEETNCTKTADITLRWECEGPNNFFKYWENTTMGKSENLSWCTCGFWHGPKEEAGQGPCGYAIPDTPDFPANEIYLNTNKTWFVDPTPNDDSEFVKSPNCYWVLNESYINQYDLYWIVKHEFGHALGLCHSQEDCDVMREDMPSESYQWPNGTRYFRGIRRHLTDRDKGRLQDLYGFHNTRINHLLHSACNDTYVSASYPDTNFGYSIILTVTNNTELAYVKFNLTGLPPNCAITSAKVHAYCQAGDEATENVDIFEVSDAWSQETITWNNAPPPGLKVSTISVNSGWVYWDVLPYVSQEYQGDKMLSVVIKMSSTGHKDFYSRDSSRNIGAYAYVDIEYRELPWVEVTPSNVTLGSGPLMNREFTVDVKVTGSAPAMLSEGWKLIAAQFKLYFDPTLIEAVSITEGPFLQDPTWNLYGTYFFSMVDTDPWGTCAIVGNMIYPNSTTGLWDQPVFPNGEGTVARLTFRALKQDQINPLECNLTLSHAGWAGYLIDKDAVYIPVNEARCVGSNYTMLPGTHDIAVLNVAPSKYGVGEGYTMDIDITMENQGDYTESFDLTVFANTTSLMSQSIMLTSKTSTTITLTWNTTGWPKGNYIISANVSLMFSETDAADNNFTDDYVTVSIVGDITGGPSGRPDGIVNLKDVFRIALNFGTYKPPQTPSWNPPWGPLCDINNDGAVNLKDYFKTVLNFGKTYP